MPCCSRAFWNKEPFLPIVRGSNSIKNKKKIIKKINKKPKTKNKKIGSLVHLFSTVFR